MLVKWIFVAVVDMRSHVSLFCDKNVAFHSVCELKLQFWHPSSHDLQSPGNFYFLKVGILILGLTLSRTTLTGSCQKWPPPLKTTLKLSVMMRQACGVRKLLSSCTYSMLKIFRLMLRVNPRSAWRSKYSVSTFWALITVGRTAQSCNSPQLLAYA